MDLKRKTFFLTLKDYTPEEITYLLDLAADLKDKKEKGGSGRFAARKECGPYL